MLVPWQQPGVAGYVLKERLGRGGLGSVYRAARPGGADVALKTVERASPSAVAALRNEIRVLRRVRHPGLVEIVDDGVEGGVPWLAMSLVEGRRLDALLQDRLEAGRPPVDRSLLGIMRRLAETLAYLHGRGVLHRDLSPRNVIVREEHPVLIDFGFASIIYDENRRRLDEFTAGLGTVPYLAPEQIRGEEVDARADLYALGCVLYEATTGRPPFVGSPQEIVRAHVTAQPLPPSKIAPGVPAQLDALIASLLSKDRRTRTAYALDVVDRLAELGADQSAAAVQPAPQVYLYECSLVGRSQLVSELDAIVSDAAGGAGSFVCLAGESGVGKTRLLAEASRLARHCGLKVLSGRCVAVDVDPSGDTDPSAGPLHPMGALLQLAADQCRDGGPAETALLFGTERPLVGELDATLRQVIGGRADRSPQSPEAAREEILAEVRHLLRALATQGPVAFVLDDLQWADELTFAVLESLRGDFFVGLPLAIVAAYRADEIHPARLRALQRSAARIAEVKRLDRDASERIAREMLGSAEAQEPIVHHVLSDAQGNPFFLTEYMRTALAQGWLRRGPHGDWSLRAPGRDALVVAQGLPLPESIKLLFERRLADLDADARDVLLAAAVVGSQVPRCCMAGVAPDIPDSRLLASLDLLCERQILRTQPDGYAFTHHKLRETIYGFAAESERRRVHQRAAACLEQHRETRAAHPPVPDETLAHHFDAGGDPQRALVYLEKAADIAFRNGAHRAAARMFGRALELAKQTGGVAHERVAVWQRKRGDARFAIGDVDGCIDDCATALALLGRPLPRTSLGWVMRVASGLTAVVLLVALGRFGRPVRRPDETLEAARCAGLLANSYYFTLSATPMLAVLLWGVLWARGSSEPALLIEAEMRLAYVAGVAGFHGLAARLFSAAGRLADGGKHATARARVRYHEALYRLGHAEWDRVVEQAEAAAEVLKKAGDVQDAEIAMTIAAHADFYRGDVTTAAVGFEAVLASARDRTNAQHVGWGLFLTARSALVSGRIDEALASLEDAHRVLRPLADRSSIAICEGLLAMAHARAGALDAAAAVLAELLPRLQGAVLPLPPCVDAYTGAAEAAVAVWRADPANGARERDAMRAVKALGRFARLFPFARPAWHRLRGETFAVRGREQAAGAELQESRRLAESLGMKLEERRSECREP
ncbi:MAG TPA: protein kinase [Polyangiaceae bacterium]|nr:protein kinase [Polyangiaceae bacterium]